MRKIFEGNGALNEEGKRLLADFRTALDNIMGSDAVSDMSSTELGVLQSNLYSYIGNLITNRISSKLQRANEFNQMTDAEFDRYLEMKYGGGGPAWFLQMSLLPEELERARQMDRTKEFLEALARGLKDREAVSKTMGMGLSLPELWFKG